MEHITAYVVDIWTFNTLGTANYDIIGGVDSIATGTVGAK
jgi:hypothetical protein